MKFALLFGGESYEHEISIVSAIALKKVLPNVSQYIFLDAEGGFWLIAPEHMRSDHFADATYRKGERLSLERGGFYRKKMLGSKRLEGFDVLINLVHGGQGEDGTLASLLEFFDIPFIGPRREASVVSCNKWLTKLYADGAGVDTVAYERLGIDDAREVKTPLPLIVKPLRLGSSIGVSVVREAGRLDYALDQAFEFDDEVLVEPFVEGIAEYNVAGCRIGDEWVIGRIEAPQKEEFLDFEQKYLDFGRTGEVAEADVDERLKEALIQAFKRVYGTLFDGALIRCDFFVHEGKILLNEINPIPGSLAHYLFDNYPDVLDRLAQNLPHKRAIRPTYAYIDKVQSAKGPKSR
ncbi:MAG: D-alanine--D-alanine ligase [Epsilonproteobacteria bacterium]|nr:D-alanine--D-alanine ligase [Campylobacterota bacterium]